MHRIVLFLAVLSIIGSIYYFFVAKDLFTGSILVLIGIAFNLIYAVLQRVNIIKK